MRSPLAWVPATVGFVVAMSMLASPALADRGRRVVVRGFEANRPAMSVHLGGTGLTLSEDNLDPEGKARLGGLNFSWRWDLVDWGGLEIDVAGLGRSSEGGLVNEAKTFVSASWLWYFARHHTHRFYGVTGIAGMGTELEIGNSSYSYGEGGFILGLGTEWLMGKHWVISFDVRALFLESDTEQPLEANEALPPAGMDREPYPVAWYSPPPERAGAMFNLGLGYRW